jgi:hypothetical protein
LINIDTPMRTKAPPPLRHRRHHEPLIKARKAICQAHLATEVVAGELHGNKDLVDAALNTRVIQNMAATDL